MLELHYSLTAVRVFIRKQTADFYRLCQEESLAGAAAMEAARRTQSPLVAAAIGGGDGMRTYSVRGSVQWRASDADAAGAGAGAAAGAASVGGSSAGASDVAREGARHLAASMFPPSRPPLAPRGSGAAGAAGAAGGGGGGLAATLPPPAYDRSR